MKCRVCGYTTKADLFVCPLCKCPPNADIDAAGALIVLLFLAITAFLAILFVG